MRSERSLIGVSSASVLYDITYGRVVMARRVREDDT